MKTVKTVTEWFRQRQGWRRESCFMCNATGLVSDYGCGEDFYGPEECRSCNGAGAYWITPRGRHVEFPGGRFL
jgi:hypothetical protein